MEINDHYIQSKSISSIAEAISSNHIVELKQFLKTEALMNTIGQIRRLKFTYTKDIMDGSYAKTKFDIKTSRTKAFLSHIFNKNIKKIDWELRVFTSSDYTILNDKKKRQYTIIINLTPTWNPSFGGQLIFTDGKGNHTIIEHELNSAVISDKTLFGFIKYVNHHARPSGIYLLVGTIK